MEQIKLKKENLESEIQSLNYKCDIFQDQVQKMEESIKLKEKEKKEINLFINQKNQEIIELKTSCNKFKHILDKVLIKFSSTSSNIQKVSLENTKLLEENQLLAIKAGLGLENLTPRPNYNSLFEEKNLKISQYIPKSKKKLTTNFIIECLLSKLSEFQGKLLFLESNNSTKKIESLRKQSNARRLGTTLEKKELFAEKTQQQTIDISKALDYGSNNSEMMSMEKPNKIEQKDENKEFIEEVIEAKKILFEII